MRGARERCEGEGGRETGARRGVSAPCRTRDVMRADGRTQEVKQDHDGESRRRPRLVCYFCVVWLLRLVLSYDGRGPSPKTGPKRSYLTSSTSTFACNNVSLSKRRKLQKVKVERAKHVHPGCPVGATVRLLSRSQSSRLSKGRRFQSAPTRSTPTPVATRVVCDLVRVPLAHSLSPPLPGAAELTARSSEPRDGAGLASSFH